MSFLSSIISVVEQEAIAVAPTVLGGVETAIAGASPIAAEALAGLKTFLGTEIGQQVESWFGNLVTHVVTPGAAVVVEPITAAPTVASSANQPAGAMS